MSHLYKEWREVLREYIERESKLNSYEFNPDNIKGFVKPRTPMEYREIIDNLTEKQDGK